MRRRRSPTESRKSRCGIQQVQGTISSSLPPFRFNADLSLSHSLSASNHSPPPRQTHKSLRNCYLLLPTAHYSSQATLVWHQSYLLLESINPYMLHHISLSLSLFRLPSINHPDLLPTPYLNSLPSPSLVLHMSMAPPSNAPLHGVHHHLSLSLARSLSLSRSLVTQYSSNPVEWASSKSPSPHIIPLLSLIKSRGMGHFQITLSTYHSPCSLQISAWLLSLHWIGFFASLLQQ